MVKIHVYHKMPKNSRIDTVPQKPALFLGNYSEIALNPIFPSSIITPISLALDSPT